MVTVVAQTVPISAPVRLPELGVEVGRAAKPERWQVRAYVRNPLRNPGLTADFALVAPPGWRAEPTGQARRAADGGGIADAWWELSPEPGPTVCAPTVEVTAHLTLGDEMITLYGQALLTHAYAASWLVAGPFPNGGKGFETTYPPELGVDPQAVMAGRDGEVRWQPLDLHDSFGYVDFTTLLSPGVLRPVRDAVAYAACNVWSPDERLVWAELSGEEQLKLWCNGSLVLASEELRLVEPRREPVKLHAGWNTVLVKATRGPQEEFSGRMFGFTFRFVDEAGTPVKELRYASWR